MYGHSQEADVACESLEKEQQKKNKQTILQKSNLYKAPPKQEFKEYYGIFSFGQYVEKSPHCYIPMGFSALQMVSRQRPLLTNYLKC